MSELRYYWGQLQAVFVTVKHGFSFAVAAVRWALAQGWTPDAGPTRAMAWSDERQEYIWLADGERHLACNAKPISREQAIRKYGVWDGAAEWNSAADRQS